MIGMRNEIENLIVRIADNPVLIVEPSEEDSRALATLRMLARSSTGKFGIAPQTNNQASDA